MNVSALAGNFWIAGVWDEDMAAASDVTETSTSVHVGFDYFLLFNIILFISDIEENLLKDRFSLSIYAHLSTWG